MTRLRCLIENQSITLNAYYMTGGQAKGNRHLTPLMLAYILEMSTYYNESISIYVYCKRTPRTVLMSEIRTIARQLARLIDKAFSSARNSNFTSSLEVTW